MKSNTGLLVLALFCCISSFAQQTSNIHIVTSENNRMGPFNFNFTVNGIPYKLKPGQCLELKVQADSVHIVMDDKRWVNPDTIDLHVAAEEHLYVQVLWGWMPDDKKKTRAIAQVVCKSCFDEYKQKCKKELMQ